MAVRMRINEARAVMHDTANVRLGLHFDSAPAPKDVSEHTSVIIYHAHAHARGAGTICAGCADSGLV